MLRKVSIRVVIVNNNNGNVRTVGQHTVNKTNKNK